MYIQISHSSPRAVRLTLDSEIKNKARLFYNAIVLHKTHNHGRSLENTLNQVYFSINYSLIVSVTDSNSFNAFYFASLYILYIGILGRI